MAVLRMRNDKYAIWPLFMAESPKFSRLKGNRVRGTRWWRQILDRKWKYGRFAHAQWQICNTAHIYGRIAEIFASKRKSGPRNTMMTSAFRLEVDIQPFRACAMNPAIIIGTVCSLWTWLWGRYHVPQNAFLVVMNDQYWNAHTPGLIKLFEGISRLTKWGKVIYWMIKTSTC